MRNDVISVIQTNTGNFIIVRPGARRLTIVVMKFSDAAIEAEVGAGVGAVCARREVRVAEPARVGRAGRQEPARVEDDRAGEERPETEGVQPREGDVARTDHQRNNVVEKRGGERHDGEEDHRRAVHREELVVLRGREHGAVGHGELRADEQRLEAAHEEEEQRRDPVE
jgi:hypothetical protein